MLNDWCWLLFMMIHSFLEAQCAAVVENPAEPARSAPSCSASFYIQLIASRIKKACKCCGTVTQDIKLKHDDAAQLTL
jgi:hypothetical protein